MIRWRPNWHPWSSTCWTSVSVIGFLESLIITTKTFGNQWYTHPRKLTWQWKIQPIWRCISFGNWGFSSQSCSFFAVYYLPKPPSKELGCGCSQPGELQNPQVDDQPKNQMSESWYSSTPNGYPLTMEYIFIHWCYPTRLLDNNLNTVHNKSSALN